MEALLLQHSGTMQGGTQSATIEVVPDSGTQDGLMGITGQMQIIRMQSAQHHYTFDYTLPD